MAGVWEGGREFSLSSWGDLNPCWGSRQGFRRAGGGFVSVSGVFRSSPGTIVRSRPAVGLGNGGLPVVRNQFLDSTGKSSGAASPLRTKVPPNRWRWLDHPCRNPHLAGRRSVDSHAPPGGLTLRLDLREAPKRNRGGPEAPGWGQGIPTSMFRNVNGRKKPDPRSAPSASGGMEEICAEDEDLLEHLQSLPNFCLPKAFDSISTTIRPASIRATARIPGLQVRQIPQR